MQFVKFAMLLVCFISGTACARSTDSISPADFRVPNPTVEERESILAKYDHIDPQQILDTRLLEQAVIYFDKNKMKIRNQRYLSVIDFSKNSREKRFYIINMVTGAVWNIHTSHGRGSDPDWDGYAQKFSNVVDSNASSLGFYLTDETYYGKHGLSLRLDGLSPTNSNARERAIVIHGADYVQNANRNQGRSFGCPAVAMESRDRVIDLLKNGSLILATHSR